MKLILIVSLFALSGLPQTAAPQGHAQSTSVHQYVDPFIGTEGLGNVTIGPSRPFGMVKPGPDNLTTANSGYSPDLKHAIFGFSQVHVSGTGGGPKYGNVSVMPFTGDFGTIEHTSERKDETTSLGYYAALLTRPNVKTEITAAAKVAYYRFTFNNPGARGILVDAGRFLNEATAPRVADAFYLVAESQLLVGSEVEVVSDREVRGYNRVRGGWNDGNAYTVYFHAVFDKPFTQFKTWKGSKLQPNVRVQFDSGDKTGAMLSFKDEADRTVQMKVGISFLSTAKAYQNILAETPGWKFDDVLGETQQAWEKLLSRVEVDKNTPVEYKKMLYTGLYHTMLMPADRTGENPGWASRRPYYEDFYAIWDTYRSSHPLITLVAPQRQVDIINAMLDIYEFDGYMPDARSGGTNGLTQGGSNADVLIADAYVKGLTGIDYELALQAMLKNADVPPGGNEKKEGRGGLTDYNTLGYVSHNFPRAGTRTLEYAYNDFNIATLAKGLGKQDIYRRFAKQANNWQNLWRDIGSMGARGFIMPRDAKGEWVDTITCNVKGKSQRTYAPVDVDYGQCVCWWCSFLYEGNSWEYSLYVPHDVAGLIEKSGGAAAFKTRLDTLFNKKYFNIANEPSFLSPNLYHWVGQPEASSARVHEIIDKSFNAGRSGLPGNDDSGATSSWLVFHLLGLYPNAGQSYYMITTPYLTESVLRLGNGRSFKIVAKGLSASNKFIVSAKLNDVPFARAWIEHKEIDAGGVLELQMGDKPAAWGAKEVPPSMRF
ncbi:MAG: GH92 family glycosyl hydrolase [Pseudomonadota bacterium]